MTGQCTLNQSIHKKLSSHLGNFTNICHTLAMRHEQLRQNESIFDTSMETGAGWLLDNKHP